MRLILATSLSVLVCAGVPHPTWAQSASGASAVGDGSTAPASALGRVSGRVVDGSGAALPGTTVAAHSPQFPEPFFTTTDETGWYELANLPVGTYDFTFDLPGFEVATHRGVFVRDRVSYVLDRTLVVAGPEETVTVLGAAPRYAPPPPPRPAPPEPRPLPEPEPVFTFDPSSVCGPSQRDQRTPIVARIAAHRDENGRRLLGDRAVLVLDAGRSVGLAPGQNLLVRRSFRTGVVDTNSTASGWRSTLKDRLVATMKPTELVGEHTSGLIQVIDVGDDTALAVVVHACDEFVVGDYIEPFEPVTATAADASSLPSFDEPARILFGDDGRTMGAPSRLMVIDRGSDHGARPGQRLTLFRRALGARGPITEVGAATVVSVKATSATIRIEQARDAVFVGDHAAVQR